MNKISRFVLLPLFFLTCSYFSAKAQCSVSQIVETNKVKIVPPYLYDGFVLTQFTMDDKPKVLRTEFMALKGQEYRLYVCTSNFDDTLGVSVYDTKKAEKGEREDILNTKTKKGEPIVFDVLKKSTYTIEYSIPVCENAEYGVTKNECVIVLISYKEK